MKQVVIVLALALSFGIISPVLAQNTTQAPQAGRNDEMQQRKVQAKEKANVAVKVFEDRISKLEKLVARIESRIAKVKADGGDVAAAEAKMVSAKAAIADAKSRLEKISKIDITAGSDRTNLNAAKAEIKATRESLIKAKQDMMKAVQLLKGLATN